MIPFVVKYRLSRGWLCEGEERLRVVTTDCAAERMTTHARTHEA